MTYVNKNSWATLVYKEINFYLNENILFDLCRFRQLTDSPVVGVVVLQQDRHLKRGGLKRVPENINKDICK